MCFQLYDIQKLQRYKQREKTEFLVLDKINAIGTKSVDIFQWASLNSSIVKDVPFENSGTLATSMEVE